MDEEIYRLVSTGLLAVIALLLLFLVARIARLERSFKSRAVGQADVPETAASVDGAVASALAGPAPASNAPATYAAAPASGMPPPITSPQTIDGAGPYEQDGRWWYRRGDELLVYDEQSEDWVTPPGAVPADASEVEPHPLEEARGWDTAPQEVTPAPIPEPVSTPEEVSPAPIPEPVSTPEEVSPAPRGGGDVVEAPEPLTGPAVEEEAATETPAATDSTHWKCPACGVINGSTATSCRMCFAARP